MRVKICGLNPTRDVQLCIDKKIAFLGFVFYEKSPRNIKLNEINILKNYNKNLSSYVAVCVNPTNDFIRKNILSNFDYIQLHGSETTERVKEIKKMGIKVIKAIKIEKERDIDTYKDFRNITDLILFDSVSMEISKRIPKSLLSKLPKGDKFGLAGSINSKNVLEYSQLGFNFLDLSSGLENKNLKGYKDHRKIKSFINKIDELKN